MNYKHLFRDILIILTIAIALLPAGDQIFNLMSAKSDFAYFGPILLFSVGFAAGLLIYERCKSIIYNYKQSEECQKKATGKSSKSKENKKN